MSAWEQMVQVMDQCPVVEFSSCFLLASYQGLPLHQLWLVAFAGKVLELELGLPLLAGECDGYDGDPHLLFHPECLCSPLHQNPPPLADLSSSSSAEIFPILVLTV